MSFRFKRGNPYLKYGLRIKFLGSKAFIDKKDRLKNMRCFEYPKYPDRIFTGEDLSYLGMLSYKSLDSPPLPDDFEFVEV